MAAGVDQPTSVGSVTRRTVRVPVGHRAVGGFLPLPASGARERPRGQDQDDDAGGELEVGFALFHVEFGGEAQTRVGKDPDDGGVGNGCRHPEQQGLADRAPDGDDEGGHHGLAVAGLQAVQGAEDHGGGQEQPGAGGTRLEQVVEGGHETMDYAPIPLMVNHRPSQPGVIR